MKRDSLGRRRTADQARGLRPLYPPLPPGVRSRSVRVAMPEAAWERLAEVVAGSPAMPPRTIGQLVERALGQLRTGGSGGEPPIHGVGRAHLDSGGPPEQTDWQEWQIRKERRLLAS